jgi:hypothetical protein
MPHLLVAANGLDAAQTLGIALDAQGRSLGEVADGDAQAACAALQEAGFAAITDGPYDGCPFHDWAENLAASPATARLFLDWQMAQPKTDTGVSGLMVAMRTLWPQAYTALMGIVDADPWTYEYADTFRVAPQSDPIAVAAYAAVQRSGCCGALDTQVEVDGQTFLVGCNYGH